MPKLFKVFAGKKTGAGSTDSEGFSSNGSFYNYLAKSKNDAIRQFRREHKGYEIYRVLTPMKTRTH